MFTGLLKKKGLYSVCVIKSPWKPGKSKKKKKNSKVAGFKLMEEKLWVLLTLPQITHEARRERGGRN